MSIPIYKIIVADDHTLFREGLIELISHWKEFQVVGEATSGCEALELCKSLRPDIILMDIQMPNMNGIEATQKITQNYPLVQVIMLTMSSDDDDLFSAIKAGARGYLLKDIHANQLFEAIRGTIRGEATLSGQIAAKILAEFNKLEQVPAQDINSKEKPDALTEREISILKYLVEGLSNIEIGRKLCLSEQTIKKDLSIIMQKLHLTNRVQVAVHAIRNDLIT